MVKKPPTLLILESLEARGFVLKKKYQWRLENLQIGFDGEDGFIETVRKNLVSPHILLRDLNLKNSDDKLYQIDLLLIMGSTILVHEIKHYRGFYTRDEKVLKRAKADDIENPELQLSRHLTRISRLKKDLGFNHFRVKGYVVYVNPNFTLYGVNENISELILPTLIQEHLKFLNTNWLPVSNEAKALAAAIKQQTVDPPIFWKDIPEYEFTDLDPGLRCEHCGRLGIEGKRVYQCSSCDYKGKINDAISAAIKEFKLLFPDKLITRSIITEWCGGDFGTSRIIRILKKNYQMVSKSRAIYYV